MTVNMAAISSRSSMAVVVRQCGTITKAAYAARASDSANKSSAFNHRSASSTGRPPLTVVRRLSLFTLMLRLSGSRRSKPGTVTAPVL